MPAYALRQWQAEEKPFALPEEISEIIDGCQDVCETAKRKLKQFLREERIQSIFEMDYPLRKAYEEYLQVDEEIQQTNRYILAFDRTKQAHIRQQMKTLAGSFEYRWRLEDKVLFLPYHPDQAVAMEFDTVRHRSNMVWDFKRDCPMSLKEQIFRTLNSVIDVFKEPRRREFRLSGLQCLYDFCVEYGIKDIETIDAKEETKFEQYLAEHTTSNSRKEMLLPILNYCRKILFLQTDEIHWNANVWYLDRLHLPKNRINPSSSFASISFAEIPHPGDRQCAKEYMKYQFGVTSRAVSTITIGYHGLRNMLVWFNEQGQSICDCTKEQMERYIKELQNQQIAAKTYNEYLVGIYQFLSFLTVRGYAKKVPFRLEYYQKKVIPTHHDRSVSPEVCMEMLKKLPLLPEHLRCMYLHLWCIGLRISEVCTLKGNAYYRQGEDAWIQVYQVKMKTYKRIPISDGLYRIMQVYIKRNGIAPDDYLFTNRSGGAYRSQTFRYQMKKFCSDNAVEGGEYLFQSHDYRHTVATFFYDSGVSLQSIRDYLGHDYEEMTEQYIDYMPRKIAAANTEFFGKPGNSLASCLKKGGKYGQ